GEGAGERGSVAGPVEEFKNFVGKGRRGLGGGESGEQVETAEAFALEQRAKVVVESAAVGFEFRLALAELSGELEIGGNRVDRSKLAADLGAADVDVVVERGK